MALKNHDWKDHANAQLSKALALAITLLLFAFLLAPRGEQAKVEEKTSAVAETTDAPADTREKEETPQEDLDLDIQDIIPEFELTDAEIDIERMAEISQQTGDIQRTTSSGLTAVVDESPLRFNVYEDPPVNNTAIRPLYPEFARKAGVKGTVVLEVEILADGRVGNIRVVESVQPGPGGLDEAAIAAVRAVSWQPAKSGGNPVSVAIILPIEFKLN